MQRAARGYGIVREIGLSRTASNNTHLRAGSSNGVATELELGNGAVNVCGCTAGFHRSVLNLLTREVRDACVGAFGTAPPKSAKSTVQRSVIANEERPAAANDWRKNSVGPIKSRGARSIAAHVASRRGVSASLEPSMCPNNCFSVRCAPTKAQPSNGRQPWGKKLHYKPTGALPFSIAVRRVQGPCCRTRPLVESDAGITRTVRCTIYYAQRGGSALVEETGTPKETGRSCQTVWTR